MHHSYYYLQCNDLITNSADNKIRLLISNELRGKSIKLKISSHYHIKQKGSKTSD